MKSLALLFPSGQRHAKRASLSLVLGTCTIAASIGLLATSGYLISRASQRPEILTLTVAIVGVRFFGIVRAICRYLERLVSHDVTFRLLADLRVRLYRRLASVDVRRLRSGDMLSRFVADVDSLQHLFLRVLAPPLVALGAIAVGVGVATAVLPLAGVLLLVALLTAATGLPLVARLAMRSAGRRRSPAQAELTAELVELLRGASELALYGGAGMQRERVLAADRRLTRLARRDAAVAGLTCGLATLVAVGAVIAVLVVGTGAVADGRLDGIYLAVLVFVALASFEAVTPLPAAAQLSVQAASASERLAALASSEGLVVDPEIPRPLSEAMSVTIEGGRLRYEADGPWVLDGVDLQLAPGKRVALVGPSGSGKSTIARVLTRFCDLDEGRATLDGHDLREYAQADVRGEILLSSDDAHLFATTIRENVRLGKPDATDGEIAGALARAGAWPWVASLPDGLDTFVGEDGELVSGGQRQRIALARVLLSDARFVILDEPTAHLDSASAKAFIDDVLEAMADRGLLLITHADVGLDRFDEVVRLDSGRTT